MKMLDYVVMANSRLRENLARAVELTDPLVKAFTASASATVRIVASSHRVRLATPLIALAITCRISWACRSQW